MAESPSTNSSAVVQRRPRAWWQWVISIGLLGTAAVLLVIRIVAWFSPATFELLYQPVEPIPLRLPSELKPAETIPSAKGELAGANVLLVTLDTTRADRLGCYGNPNIKTPVIDGLARDGILFTKAYSAGPTTLPSHSTMMTGLYPIHHGARANSVYRLSEKHPTLAQIMSDSGYATGAVISAFVLDSRFGLARGFDTYNDDLPPAAGTHELFETERIAVNATNAAIDWIKLRKGKPFFYWVHYFDPHQPYRPPEPYAQEYESLPYDGEIAYVDTELGRLLDFLEESEVRDNTLVIVVGDHGQGLGQHGELTHGFLLYDGTLHVPLIMSCGKRLGGGVHIDRSVSLVDLAPTVLSLLGMPAIERCDGLDLTQKAPDAPRVTMMDTLEGLIQQAFAPLIAIREGDLKYIYGPQPELYDLKNDPYEANDLFASRPEEAERMRELLQRVYGDDLASAAQERPSEQLSPGDIEMLRSLGYTVSGVTSASDSGVLPNPKDMLGLVTKVETAIIRGEGETAQDVIDRLQKVIAEAPDFFMAHRWLAVSYLETDNYAGAEAELKISLELHPDIPETLVTLAWIAAKQNRVEDAKKYYEQTIEKCPDYFDALAGLGHLYLSHNQPRKAADLLLKACIVRPTDQPVVDLLANAMKRADRLEDAIRFLEDRIKKNPSAVAVRNALAGVLLEKGECERSIALIREGLQRHPEIPEFVNNLAFALVRCAGESPLLMTEASLLMEKRCEESNYTQPAYMRTLAMVYASMRRPQEAVQVAERALKLAKEMNGPRLIRQLEDELAKYRSDLAIGITPMSPYPSNLPTSAPTESAPSSEN